VSVVKAIVIVGGKTHEVFNKFNEDELIEFFMTGKTVCNGRWFFRSKEDAMRY
jgi:hypothetical protein